MPAAGGAETALVEHPDLEPKAFELSRTGLYFETRRRTGAELFADYAIRYLTFESSTVSVAFQGSSGFEYNRFAVSPDDQWILVGGRPHRTSELVLVENYR